MGNYNPIIEEFKELPRIYRNVPEQALHELHDKYSELAKAINSYLDTNGGINISDVIENGVAEVANSEYLKFAYKIEQANLPKVLRELKNELLLRYFESGRDENELTERWVKDKNFYEVEILSMRSIDEES